ncbi:DUF3291 domain-containing protein [uncultured Algibacter sp.]|uniref:DUF3291 domain-containing protein n=1 Tax=uncultured Algibacter sp. TaxID=298659 RepID=UPI003216E1B0
MQRYHLAQVNIAKGLGALNDPIMKDFIDNVAQINTIADTSDGFIWRLKDEDKDEALQIFKDDLLIINMSVWSDVESLFKYVYKSGHIEVLKRKKEWFKKNIANHMAFWYIPKGNIPTFNDAKIRLDYLNLHGETPYAFTFKSKFSVTESLNYKVL